MTRRARASAGVVTKSQKAVAASPEATAAPKKADEDAFGGAPAPLEPSGALSEEQIKRATMAEKRKSRAGLWAAIVIALLLAALVVVVGLRGCSRGGTGAAGATSPTIQDVAGGGQ